MAAGDRLREQAGLTDDEIEDLRAALATFGTRTGSRTRGPVPVEHAERDR
jgi:hypothetical protein